MRRENGRENGREKKTGREKEEREGERQIRKRAREKKREWKRERMRGAAGLTVLLPLARHMPVRPNLALFVPIMLMSALGGRGSVWKLLRDGI